MPTARPPLLLLSGTLCTAALWQHQLEHLGDLADARAPALAGECEVGCAAARVLEEAPPRFALAGFSMGALVAFEIVRQAPERVGRLALIAANPNPATSAQAAAWREAAERATAGRFQEVAEGFTGGLSPEHPRHVELRRAVLTMAQEVGSEGFLKQLRLLETRPDSRPMLAHVRCPTLLLVGRHDAVTPPALHEEMRARLPHAALVVVEDSGHYAPLEQPQAVTALLAYWLQGNPHAG